MRNPNTIKKNDKPKKKSKQDLKIEHITEQTLVVGIDVGSEVHFARAFNWRKIEESRKPFKFTNTVEGFKAFKSWIDKLKIENGFTTVAASMEPTGHYWYNLAEFLKCNGIEVFHVNPAHVHHSKEMDDNNPNKNDRKDPKIIAELLTDGRYMTPYMPEGIYAEIRGFYDMFATATEEMTRTKNRLAKWFNIYFPNCKTAYKDLYAVSLMIVLEVAPLPEDIVALGPEKINDLWRKAKLRGVGLSRAQILVKTAQESLCFRTAHDSARYQMRLLLEDYRRILERHQLLESSLKELMEKVPFAKKLLAIKGIGFRTVIGFIAEVGDISRFKNPKEIQKLAGLAIVNDESCKFKGSYRISHRGRSRLRYVLYEAAVSVVGKNTAFAEIHTYFTTRKNNPLKKMQSIVAIECKLIRVFYALATKNVEYDEAKMVSDIRRPAA